MGKAHKKINCSIDLWRNPGSSHNSVCKTFERMFRCRRIAPLDTPVVPPVYCKKAMSSKDKLGGVRCMLEPLCKASPNFSWARFQLGTAFLTFRTTKSTTVPLIPMSSPRLVTTVFLRGTAATICS